jgi:hypothetical protein
MQKRGEGRERGKGTQGERGPGKRWAAMRRPSVTSLLVTAGEPAVPGGGRNPDRQQRLHVASLHSL